MTNLSDLVGGAPIPAYIGSFKNKIINGSFDIWQRGTTEVGVSSSKYLPDRFEFQISSDAVVTLSRSETYPTIGQAGRKFNYSYSVDVTTADAAIAAAQYAHINYKIEGYDTIALLGQVCTLSFWVYSTKTGTCCVNFRSSNSDRCYVAEYTVNSSNTWEYKTVTFAMEDGSTGTWNYTNGTGLNVAFQLACGTTYQGTANIWQNSTVFSTSSQINCLDSTDNVFRLTGIQLELGSSASNFESRSYQQELALCQRYFIKLASTYYIPRGYGNEGYLNLLWPVPMRTTPTADYSTTADTPHFVFSSEGISGYIIDDWTGTPALSAGAEFDAEL